MSGTSACATFLGAGSSGSVLQVPNSIGTAPPKLKAPPNASDCHHHICDPARFPFAPQPGRYPPPSNGTVSDYRMLQKRIGTNRSIIVQQRNNAVDNRVALDAIAQLEPNSRGIAVLRPTVSDTELSELNDGGIRGIRFTLGDPATAVVTADI